MSMIQAIKIAVDDTTLTALRDLGYALYMLRAVNTNNAGAKALVWSALTDAGSQTSFEIGSAYQAYVKVSAGTIDVSYAVDVVLGDVFTYVPGGAPNVAPGGYPQGVTVLNGTSEPLTAGLAGGVNGAPSAPFVSAPLHGLGGDIFSPQDSFLVTFSTAGLRPGDPLTTSMSQSLLINMNGLTEAAASFDINKGWNYDGATWGQVFAAGANLQKVLVKTMPLTRSAI